MKGISSILSNLNFEIFVTIWCIIEMPQKSQYIISLKVFLVLSKSMNSLDVLANALDTHRALHIRPPPLTRVDERKIPTKIELNTNIITPTYDKEHNCMGSFDTCITSKEKVTEMLFPCRARRMGPTHTFQTAYFRISPETPHGSDLFCSHLECREEGVKFRYCKYCRIPVAKRNFRNRHSHHVKTEKNPEISNAVSEISYIHSLPEKRKFEGFPRNEMESTCEMKQLHKKQKDEVNFQKKKICATSSQIQIRYVNREQKMHNNTSHAINLKPVATYEGTERRKESIPIEWINLFHLRPSSTNAKNMSQWLNQVIQASEPSSPFYHQETHVKGK